MTGLLAGAGTIRTGQEAAGPGTTRHPAGALAPLAAQKVGSSRLTGTVMYDR